MRGDHLFSLYVEYLCWGGGAHRPIDCMAAALIPVRSLSLCGWLWRVLWRSGESSEIWVDACLCYRGQGGNLFSSRLENQA